MKGEDGTSVMMGTHRRCCLNIGFAAILADEYILNFCIANQLLLRLTFIPQLKELIFIFYFNYPASVPSDVFQMPVLRQALTLAVIVTDTLQTSSRQKKIKKNEKRFAKPKSCTYIRNRLVS